MGVLVRYTTGYDYLFIAFKCISIGLWAGFLGQVIEVFGLNTIQFPEQEWLKLAAMIVFLAVFMWLAILCHQFTTLPLINTFSAYLYVNKTLKTQMTFSEVSKIKEMFTPNDTGNWHPCREVLDLPEKERSTYVKKVYMKIYGSV